MEALILAVGGLVGSGAKAWSSMDQATISKQTIIDVVLGAAVGFLYPLYPVIDFPAAANIYQKAVMLAVVAYFSVDMVSNLAARFGGARK